MMWIMGSDEVRRGSFQAANTNLPASSDKLQWRTSQRGNPYALVDGFHVVVFRRQTGQWSLRIEEIDSGETWYSEGRFVSPAEAKAVAFQQLERMMAQDLSARVMRL